MRGVLGLDAQQASMVRSSSNDEVDPQHSASCPKEPRQGPTYPPKQLHDDPAIIRVWISAKCRSEQIHTDHSILV